MERSASVADGKTRFSLSSRRLLAAIVGTILFIGVATAQDPGTPSVSGLPSNLQVIPSRPPARPDEAKAFLKGLTTSDALIEVMTGQSRILTTSADLTAVGKAQGVITVGDPSVADVNVLNARTLRLVGNRIGVTDLTLITPDGTVFSYEIRVFPDLEMLRTQMKGLFPQAKLNLSMIRDHLAVEGEVRTSEEKQKVIETIQAYLESVQSSQMRTFTQASGSRDPRTGLPPRPGARPEEKGKGEDKPKAEEPPPQLGAEPPTTQFQATVGKPKVIDLISVVAETNLLQRRLSSVFPDAEVKVTQVGNQVILEGQARDAGQVARIVELVRGAVRGDPSLVQTTRTTRTTGVFTRNPGLEQSETETPLGPQIINLIRVPTSQQVLLKVRIAELNRTAARTIGADFLAVDPSSGTAVGSGLGNANISASGQLLSNSFITQASSSAIPGQTTAFGVFGKDNFEIFINALRRNQVLKILAEPNLVALNGQRANFLAGGQFFIPTAQTAAGGVAGAITAQPVDFGVRLDFQAHLLDDEVIRLTVSPEVSQPDFTVATSLVAGGSPVPGLNKRSAHTTVELRQGQTLAIAGLMQVTLDGTTNRFPGLGDLPILGPFFSNTTSTRTEKELLVMVTPYLVEPMNADQVPCGPGDEVNGPTDFEFFFLNRLEGRTGRDHRATTEYDDPQRVLRRMLRLHERHVRGPFGYCD